MSQESASRQASAGEYPRVSVVIPTHNAERFIGQTIASVRAQSWIGWELIVVDDGSTDGTLAVVEGCIARDTRVRVLPLAHNGRVSAARNAGIRASHPSAEFLIFLDADDLWERDALATLVDLLDRHADAAAAYCNSRLIDADGKPPTCWEADQVREARNRRVLQGFSVVDLPPDAPRAFAFFVYQGCPPVGAVLARRRLVLEAGLFDESLTTWETWDLWIRMSLRGAFVFVDRVLFYYRRHDANVSNDADLMVLGRLAVRNKVLQLPGLHADQRRQALFCKHIEYLQRTGLEALRKTTL